MMSWAHRKRAGGAPTRSMLLSDWSTYRGLIWAGGSLGALTEGFTLCKQSPHCRFMKGFEMCSMENNDHIFAYPKHHQMLFKCEKFLFIGPKAD